MEIYNVGFMDVSSVNSSLNPTQRPSRYSGMAQRMSVDCGKAHVPTSREGV